ncbi:MAG: hypothetical protein LAT50_12505 [Ectothiorhodospiraceae bacterium]|nr:hypothetical protein [Ectothiorhodospiraceae bacterium]
MNKQFLALLLALPLSMPLYAALDEDNWIVDEDQLPFDALPDVDTERRWGLLDGAGYRWEIPENWNGDLIIYARPLRGSDNRTLEVVNPPRREALLKRGYAWAASSFDFNGYHVNSGVKHSRLLLEHFSGEHAPPGSSYIIGHDLGGQVAAASAEQHPDLYAGALAMCAPLVDTQGLNYLMAYNLAAQAIAGLDSRFPDMEFQQDTREELLARLGPEFPGLLYPAGEELVYLHTRLSGGPHALSHEAVEAWSTLLFDFGHMDGTLGGLEAGNVISTRDVRYALPDPEREEWLNENVLRLEPDPQVVRGGTAAIPATSGEIGIPVLTLGSLGDLYTPLSMQQAYAQRVAGAGQEALLVPRVVRDVGHCTFTEEEELQAFDDLTDWAANGSRPAGDPVNDPDAVAGPAFGCAHTRGQREGLPACP